MPALGVNELTTFKARVTSRAQGQSYNCPGASGVSVKHIYLHQTKYEPCR